MGGDLYSHARKNEPKATESPQVPPSTQISCYSNYRLAGPLLALGNSKGTVKTALLEFRASATLDPVASAFAIIRLSSAAVGGRILQPKDLKASLSLFGRGRNDQ